MQNKTSYIKLHRAFFRAPFKDLFSDQEFHLWLAYAQACGWDTRHRNKFGIVEMTQKEFKECFIGRGSTGKISETRSSLIKKGFLGDAGRGKTKVIHFWMFQDKDYRRIEEAIRQIENNIQPVEQERQFIEETLSRGKYLKLKKTFANRIGIVY